MNNDKDILKLINDAKKALIKAEKKIIKKDKLINHLQEKANADHRYKKAD